MAVTTSAPTKQADATSEQASSATTSPPPVLAFINTAHNGSSFPRTHSLSLGYNQSFTFAVRRYDNRSVNL